MRVQAAFGGGLIGGGVQVQQFAVVGQRLEAVGEAFRDQQASGGCRRDSSACQCRKVGEPWRRSTATSKTSPRRQLTSFISACGGLLEVHAAHRAALAV